LQREMNENVVLDASALLAFINQEPGGEVVAESLDRAVISAINLSEVIAKFVDKKVPESVIQRFVAQLRVEVIPVDQEQAVTAGLLRSQTKSVGLSLGDRVCLALALQQNCPVLTTDRAWGEVKLGIEVRLIR
jgi:PIN domain nuclease of toxin-antitoxin system